MGLRRATTFIFLFILFIAPFIGICDEFLQSTTETDSSGVIAPIPQNSSPLFRINSQLTNFDGKIVGTGLPANVTLLCNKSGGPSAQNSNSNITIPIPNPWSIVYSNLTIINVLQKSGIAVEDSITAQYTDIGGYRYAMQFNASGTDFLTDFSVYVYGFRILNSLSFEVYDAKLLDSRPCPDSVLYSESFLTLPYTDSTSRWYNLTFSSFVALNASNTYDHAFFIQLYPSIGSSGYFRWGYESDTGNSDNGAAYQNLSSNWVLQAVDFNLKVSLINTPKQPSEINLKINGTSVSNKNLNDGEWISTTIYSYLSNTVNFQFSADISAYFLVTWALLYRSIPSLQVVTSFLGVDTDALIYWNATYSATFVAGSSDNRLYFDLPAWPTIIGVRRNQSLHSFWNSSLQGSVRKVSILNAESGSWIIQCSDKNYVEKVFSKRSSVVVSVVNSTDLIEVYSNFTDFLTTGDANLTIFPNAANYNDTVGEGITNNKTIQFSPAWCMVNTASGYYKYARLQVSWFNGTAAGIRTANLTVNHVPTNLTLLSYTPSIISGASIFLLANFTNQYTKGPMLGASLLVKNSTDGVTWPTSFQIINDYLNGTYRVEILSLGLSGGNYSLSINFSKFLYYSSEIADISVTIGGIGSNVSVTAPNCVGLQSINQSYALANPVPYHNSSVRVTIYYYSNFTLEPLRNAIITLSWVGGGPEGSWVPAFFGYYNITIDVMGFHSGTNHTLKIQIQEIGYLAAELYVIVPIKKLPTLIEPLSSSYSGYTEETLNIYAIFQDTFNGKSIPSIYDLNGNFAIRIGNFTQNMTLLSPIVGIYSYVLSISAFALIEGNTYTITFSAFSSEHEFATINVSLYIIPKSPVDITFLTEPGYLLAGTQFSLYTRLTDLSGTPIYNIPLVAKYIFQPGSLETQVIQLTNGSGIAQFDGEANALMESLQIQITYNGNMTLQNRTIYSDIIPIIKLNSSLNLGLHPATIQTGQNFALNATLSINGTLAGDKPVTFTFTYEGSDRVDVKPAATSITGIAQVNLTVPLGVSKIYILASYDGISYVIASSAVSEIAVEKLSSSLTINPLPFEILEGKTLVISASLLINGSPGADQLVTFIFTYDGLTQVDKLSEGTDSEGKVFSSLIVPSGARRIHISVSFAGLNYINATSAESELTVISGLTLIARAAPFWGGAIAAAIGAFLYYNYRYRRPKIRKELKQLEEIAIKFEDIKHINYLLFLYKKNGVPLFEYAVQIADLNPVLIGGFLNAISSFKDSIIQSEKKTQADRWELDYENFKISWVTGELTYFSILSEKKLSDSTRKSIANLLTEFEETFRKPLTKFSGDVKIFMPTLKLIQKHLEIDLILPHQVDLAKVHEITQFKKTEWALIDLATTLQKELGPFFLSKLISTAASARGESELKLLGVTYDLWKRKVFIPISEDGLKAKDPEGKKSK
ncbi:MAG: hypothetical protein LUQ65_05555 [Candidatus Helarchaeota archaeon]|nr:hypothetical protein [Candidatus Helarchaeota archaeon]